MTCMVTAKADRTHSLAQDLDLHRSSPSSPAQVLGHVPLRTIDLYTM